MTADQAAWISAAAAAISAFAALVALIAAAALVWLQWRAGRPRLEVVGVTSIVFTSTYIGETKYGIDVRNVGLVPVVVTSVGVLLPGAESLGTLLTATGPQGEQVLPKKLEPGDAVSVTNPLEPIIEEDVKRRIRGVFARTATGKTYRGKNTVDLASFRKSPNAEAAQ